MAKNTSAKPLPTKKRKTTGKKTNPETIAARLKAAQALNLRMEGKTFEDIAKELKYNSKQSAFDAVKRALDSVVREPAESLITLDLERLDVLWQIQYLGAQAGDVSALGACMRIMERRAKLLGLDATRRFDEMPEAGRAMLPVAITIERRSARLDHVVPE